MNRKYEKNNTNKQIAKKSIQQTLIVFLLCIFFFGIIIDIIKYQSFFKTRYLQSTLEF